MQKDMETYNNMVEAINGLKQQGYTEDFNLADDCLVCRAASLKFTPDEFTIDKFFRFEDDTDPASQSILYAISADQSSLKGVLVNAYGLYSEENTSDLIKKLSVHESK